MATFEDILLRLGRRVGFVEYDSDNRPILPTDDARLARLKEAVNAGRETLYAERGGNWHWMLNTEPVTLSADGTASNCIDGDGGKVLLPESVQGPDGSLAGVVNAAGTSGGAIELGAVSRVRILKAQSPALTGVPVLAAVQTPHQDPSSTGGRAVLWIYPKPSEAFVVTVPVRRRYAPMLELTDVELCPFPEAVAVYAALAFQGRGAVPEGGSVPELTAERDEWLSRLIAEDSLSRPRTLGQSRKTNEPDPREALDQYRPSAGTVNGVPV